MTILRRIGAWVLAALAVVLPVWGWLRERRARQEAEARHRYEVALARRESVHRRQLRVLEASHRERVSEIQVQTEKVAAPIEARAAEVRVLGAEAEAGDEAALQALADRLNGASK